MFRRDPHNLLLSIPSYTKKTTTGTPSATSTPQSTSQLLHEVRSLSDGVNSSNDLRTYVMDLYTYENVDLLNFAKDR